MSLAEVNVPARETPLFSGPPGRRAAPTGLLRQLLAGLAESGVPYCYWKQVAKLDRALSGLSDLDLLVARRARDSLFAVMQAHGFKAWPDAGLLGQPAFVSFLGYDEASGLVVHVHVHFRLILGAALLKTFSIPIEDDLIARSVLHARHPIRILDPLDEALMLRLRAALDGGWLDALAWRRRFRPEPAPAEARDGPIDAGDLQARAETWLSPDCAQSLADPAADAASHALRRKLKRDLRPWRLFGPIEGAVRLLIRTLFLVLAVLYRRYVRGPRFARRPAPGGGALVAFVGVDGSGKSTQVAQTSRWLSDETDVMTCYFGSGDGAASILFRPVKAVAEAIGSRLRVKPKGASHGRVSDRPPGPIYSAMFVVWALAVALDKRVKLAAAQRAVSRGFLVIADRYPQNEIPLYNDGPLLHRLPAAPAWLRQWERSVYERARRSPPDLVIKLHVGAATVAKREPEMRPELIQQRIEWLKELTCGGADSISIDASLPLAEVTRIVKRAVWDIL